MLLPYALATAAVAVNVSVMDAVKFVGIGIRWNKKPTPKYNSFKAAVPAVYVSFEKFAGTINSRFKNYSGVLKCSFKSNIKYLRCSLGFGLGDLPRRPYIVLLCVAKV
jgi:hypothetical protein